ncbi:hypothetical protein K438DRAFT_2027348 [Mycena galopus ATCC 62051]|nr:hypothetical protein K438DRAFT_2027348 [Mycena galopus ATCC 62051]
MARKCSANPIPSRNAFKRAINAPRPPPTAQAVFFVDNTVKSEAPAKSLQEFPTNFYHCLPRSSLLDVVHLFEPNHPHPQSTMAQFDNEFIDIYAAAAAAAPSSSHVMDEFTDIFTMAPISSEPPTDSPVDADTEAGYGSAYCVVA